MFQANFQQRGEFQIIYLAGAVDIESRAELQEALDTGMSGSSRKLIVNLKDVESISSSGVGMLLNATRELKKFGGNLVLAEPSTAARHVLTLLHLSDFFNVFKTVDAAVDWYRSEIN